MDTEIQPTLSRDDLTNENKMEDVAGAVAPSTSTTNSEEPGKRRHSTPTCGTAHLSRLSADLRPADDDDDVSTVRCRRSCSAAPRRINRPTNDDNRRNALPPWAEAVRSSRTNSTSSQRCTSGSVTAELGHNGVRSQDSSTNDARGTAASSVRRRELLQTNYSSDGRLDRIESTGNSARCSGNRFESPMPSDIGSSPPCDHAPPSQPPTAGPARLPRERRSSLAFLPVSAGSISSGPFSPRHVAPSSSTKDRINLGFGNASDFMASLISSKSPSPASGAAEDHFWVPPTVWRKKRTQSLVPPKQSIDTKTVSGRT